MKTYRNLYPQVCDWDNLYLAYRKARKGKRSRAPAASFEFHQEAYLVALQRELTDKTYQPGRYHSFYIHEPKRRLISAAPFRANRKGWLLVVAYSDACSQPCWHCSASCQLARSG